MDDYKAVDYGGLRDYQCFARDTAVYPEQNSWGGLVYTVLGLNGEAGEVAEKVKKFFRDVDRDLPEEYIPAYNEFKKNMQKELGDVLWYLANTCEELGIELADVAAENLDKLYSRKERGVLHGSGDNR